MLMVSPPTHGSPCWRCFQAGVGRKPACSRGSSMPVGLPRPKRARVVDEALDAQLVAYRVVIDVAGLGQRFAQVDVTVALSGYTWSFQSPLPNRNIPEQWIVCSGGISRSSSTATDMISLNTDAGGWARSARPG